MKEIRFFDEIHDMQRFVRNNVNLLGNYLIISEQLYMKNNETGIIDMLAVDFDNRNLVIIELKNEITTDKNIWQPLRYYDLVRRGEEDLKQLLLKASSVYNFNANDIELNVKLLLVVPQCNEQLLRALSYFNDIDSKVIELKRHLNDGKEIVEINEHFPTSVFHKEDIVDIQNKVTKNWNFDEYKKMGINSEKIKIANTLANQMKSLFENKGYKYDIFFNQTKVSILKNNKVWAHLFIKQNALNHYLTISFKISKETVINKNDFIYNDRIESYDFKDSSIKIKINESLDRTFLEKYI
ncbi:Endonuclease NucS [compost metagenome]